MKHTHKIATEREKKRGEGGGEGKETGEFKSG